MVDNFVLSGRQRLTVHKIVVELILVAIRHIYSEQTTLTKVKLRHIKYGAFKLLYIRLKGGGGLAQRDQYTHYVAWLGSMVCLIFHRDTREHVESKKIINFGLATANVR